MAGGDGIRPERVERVGYDVGGEGKEEGDGSAAGDDDDKAIGSEVNVRHPNQQSTNNGGKQMQRTVWGGAGGREAAKPPQVKRPALQQEP